MGSRYFLVAIVSGVGGGFFLYANCRNTATVPGDTTLRRLKRWVARCEESQHQQVCSILARA